MEKKSYDLYGIECEGIDITKAVIETLLNIVMVAHESGYHCGEYYRFNDVGQEHFILQYNYDDFEDEWTEEAYSKYPLLLFVNETLRSNELEECLRNDKKIVLLKHQKL